jgi:DNA-binding response OmpR family regulator
LTKIKAPERRRRHQGQMPPLAPSRPRVTIVEDDVSLLNALAFALEADGYAVSPYTAAAPLLAQPPSADCMVVDRRLPDMDGLALIQALRALGPQPTAILITSNPDDRLRRAAATAGVAIVEKPLIGGELRQRIADAVRERPH